MKTEFEWYFSASEEEVGSIWEQGLLTVDANVLLDLYRYHEATRSALVTSLKAFGDRLWLSNQAAEEFIRNRTKVIISSEKTFKQAKEEVEKLRKNLESAVSQLKGNRLIPSNIADSLSSTIDPAINSALEEISNSKSSYPKYLQTDPILDDLAEMFSGSIGEAFSEDDFKKYKDEAEQRKKNEIPPGYMDKEKDGDRPYGDYFLWRQILSHAKNKDVPVIFVTSERKEDWWEKLSGKTIGPRPELLREAYKYCGRRILIYQTDRFLEYSSKRAGSELDESAVEEIRAIDSLRSEVEQAVEVIEQNIQNSSEEKNEGLLVVNLHRPVKNLTCSGSLEPHMHQPPIVKATLEESPSDIPKIKIRAGTGTDYDFNLHVISSEYGIQLPVGRYVLKYSAICEGPEDESEENAEENI